MSERSPLVSISHLGLALGLVFQASQGQAYGVRGITSTSETICASATYDDGEPMSYGRVEISAPDSKLPYQSGRTDRNGFFCFKPDSPGMWRLIISDEMGHRVSLKTTVNQDITVSRDNAIHEHNARSMGKIKEILSGIAFIFGLGGFLAWWRSKKKSKKTPE
jgi:nickel transport protein